MTKEEIFAILESKVERRTAPAFTHGFTVQQDTVQTKETDESYTRRVAVLLELGQEQARKVASSL